MVITDMVGSGDVGVAGAVRIAGRLTGRKHMRWPSRYGTVGARWRSSGGFAMERTAMKISILGLGYVGAVSMACLARDRHELLGVDVDPLKLELIRSGKSPIVEEGIQQLMQEVVASGRVRVTDDPRQAIAETDLS